MKKVFIINWKRSDDLSNASQYSAAFMNNIPKGVKITEIFLHKTEGNLPAPDHINKIGPFDERAKSFFGRKTVKRVLREYILKTIESFVDSIIIVFDPRVFDKIPSLLLKECRIAYIQAYEHQLAEHKKIMTSLSKKRFLKENINLTVTSCIDDLSLFKSLFNFNTINISSELTYLKLENPKEKSGKYVIFYGDYKSMPWKKIYKFLEAIGKKGVIYSHADSINKDRQKYESKRLIFVESKIRFEKYMNNACLFNPMESTNISISIAQSMASGVPLLFFKEGVYSRILLENETRGIFVDYKNPDVELIKAKLDKDYFQMMSTACIIEAQAKFSDKKFKNSVDNILRRLQR